MNYQAYLRTPHWRATRLRKLATAKHQCEFRRDGRGPRCQARLGLQVHHRHYRSIGRENDLDLELLCPDHHRERHGLNQVELAS